MTATNKLLDKYKETCSIASDNAAAVSLGISRATVSGWRHGLAQANPATIARMAAAIGEDEGRWLATVESERARSSADRKAWATVARRLGAAAAVALCAVALPLIASPDADLSGAHFSAMYIM